METEKYVFNATELAKRWNCSPTEISRLKHNGVITPMPGFHSKYSLDMVLKVETAGIDDLSCVKKLRYENTIKGLRTQIEELNRKLENIKSFIQTI